MRILFLDDERYRTKKFLWDIKAKTEDRIATVATAKDCIERLEDEEWDFVFLDHDLGGKVYVDSNREDCGMEVVRHLQANKKKICCVFVHSLNEPARINMVSKLKDAGYNAMESKFTDIDWKNLHNNLQRILANSIDTTTA